MPLSASGTEKRQFQPAKNPGQRFLLSSLDGVAIALARPFLYFRLENKYCAKFTCAFRLFKGHRIANENENKVSSLVS